MLLEFLTQIDPVALTVFGFPIRWYGIAYFTSFIFCWYYGLYLVKKMGTASDLTAQHIEDFILWAVLAVIIGGRLGYIAFYRPYLFAQPEIVFSVWQGGMSFHGATIGVILAMWAFTKFHKISIFSLSDIAATVIPFGLFLGRCANFINQELVGRVTDVAWAVRFPLYDNLPRHPSQLYEAFFEGFALFVIMNISFYGFKSYLKPGRLSAYFLIFYGFFRFCAEYYREPTDGLGFLWQGLTAGQLYSLPVILLGIIVFFVSLRKGKKSDTSTD